MIVTALGCPVRPSDTRLRKKGEPNYRRGYLPRAGLFPAARGSAAAESASTFARSIFKNDSPLSRKRCSSRSVQSHEMHAHGSLPFSSRHRRRSCASCTRASSKYSSQYGRSSRSGLGQKHTSTQRVVRSSQTRASCMLRRYSSPATEPCPSVPFSIALSRSFSRPGLTLARTRYRTLLL